MGTVADKPSVFISYARSDSAALAEELVVGLGLAGFTPYLDRTDIAAAEDWEARLGALILAADTIVFVLTPAAVRSPRCAWEVERAAELGKRLIPVQGEPVTEADVPERLRRLNYIFFRQGQSFARPLSELAVTLRQDVAWIREHTRLTEAAVRWRARGQGAGAGDDLLLRGDELAEAKAWTARRKADAPEITPLLADFLAASEARAAAVANEERDRLKERERLVAEREQAQRNVRRVQRRWFRVLVGLAVAVVLGTGTGLWAVFNGWSNLITNQAWFIAGMADQQAGQGDYVTAMLVGLDALPDANSAGIRQRVLRPEGSALNALASAWRHWLSGWGERAVLAGHTGFVSAVAFSPDGAHVLTGSDDKSARLWDAATGWPVATLAGHAGPVRALAFSPDGTRVLTGSDDKTVRLWNAATGQPLPTPAGYADSVMAVAFLPDGTLVMTGSGENTVRLWDWATGKSAATFTGHTGLVQAVAFSPDGTRVLTGSDDNTARLWDAATGKPVAILGGHTDTVEAVAFSHDGTHVLTGSSDRTARLWDAATGKPAAVLAGHTGPVLAVAFSPDGTRVLTGSSDNTARLWDAASGKPVAILGGHTDAVSAVAFSPDGTRVLTGSSDKTARLWDATIGRPVVFRSTQDLVEAVKAMVPRCLTPEQREAFHLGTPPPRWCYARNLWPFADQAAPPTSSDERFVAAWDWIGSWLHKPPAKRDK